MRYTIDILELAEQDIRDAFLDYESKQDGLGDAFEQEISRCVEYIKQEAQAIQIRQTNIRICFLKRFPFGIHFILENNHVLITGVYAMKDNPFRWR
jgi:hypothetical protein